ncbi:sugar fermentation stimulation protein A [Amaricoccus macauensis]|uniref:Sugar fermentation stimulation protein homolog n=1 Tax=Amaricoccus macauensis TaxID=57001 RepID=A0A840SLD6_9RHOB|nr:DNA/RNA nuclease SfsA [Amaricoccus macauensis]MBB5221560.1 sugar fermentation stimulation protein A [Amaricoccus macauensis]
MRFATPLVRGRLVQRYKRFLADVILDDGRAVTAHCANPGAMLGLKDPGVTVWLEHVPDPRRALAWSWRLVELPDGHLAGIDTSLPNRIVAEALAEDRIPGLTGYQRIRPEVRYATKSRVDFLLSAEGRPDAYVEVKNVHLRRTGRLAEFPDSVTARGARHLADLAAMVAEGHRAVMLYVVQRTDCDRFAVSGDLDPAYAAAYAAARAQGVEVLVHTTRIDRLGITLDQPLPALA